MIVIDSSIWIDHFRGHRDALKLLDRVSQSDVLVGDLVMAEVLQGFRREADFSKAHEVLSSFQLCSMVGREVAIETAHNYRSLRDRGVTPLCAIDTLIATFCLINGHQLAHNDRDFDFIVEHLGLAVLLP